MCAEVLDDGNSFSTYTEECPWFIHVSLLSHFSLYSYIPFLILSPIHASFLFLSPFPLFFYRPRFLPTIVLLTFSSFIPWRPISPSVTPFRDEHSPPSPLTSPMLASLFSSTTYDTFLTPPTTCDTSHILPPSTTLPSPPSTTTYVPYSPPFPASTLTRLSSQLSSSLLRDPYGDERTPAANTEVKPRRSHPPSVGLLFPRASIPLMYMPPRCRFHPLGFHVRSLSSPRSHFRSEHRLCQIRMFCILT